MLELKNTITKLKNSREGFSSRLYQIEERINKVEDRSFEIMQAEMQKPKRIKSSEESLRYLRDISKWTNIRIMVLPEGKRKGQNVSMKK